MIDDRGREPRSAHLSNTDDVTIMWLWHVSIKKISYYGQHERLFDYFSVSLFVCLPVFQSYHVFLLNNFDCLLVCQLVCIIVRLFVCPFVCLSVFQTVLGVCFTVDCQLVGQFSEYIFSSSIFTFSFNICTTNYGKIRNRFFYASCKQFLQDASEVAKNR